MFGLNELKYIFSIIGHSLVIYTGSLKIKFRDGFLGKAGSYFRKPCLNLQHTSTLFQKEIEIELYRIEK